jgi:hypothetical protein
VEVTTVVESPGQLVTVGAQEVIVISSVVQTVEVVQSVGTGVVSVGAGGVVVGWLHTVEGVGGVVLDSISVCDEWGGISVGGFGPVEQSKSMRWMLISHSPNLLSSGRVNSTATALPHCSLVTSVPLVEPQASWRQVDPSAI